MSGLKYFLLLSLLIIFVFLSAQQVFSFNQKLGVMSSSSGNCVFPCSVTISWYAINGSYVEIRHSDGTYPPEFPRTHLPLITLSDQPVSLPNGDNTFELWVDGTTKVASISIANVTPAPIQPTATPIQSGQSIAPTNTPAPTDSPSTTISSVKKIRHCNESCLAGDEKCASGLSCSSGVCRLKNDPNRDDCGASLNPTVTPVPTRKESPPTATAAELFPSPFPTAEEVLGAKIEEPINPPKNNSKMLSFIFSPLTGIGLMVFLSGGLAVYIFWPVIERRLHRWL